MRLPCNLFLASTIGLLFAASATAATVAERVNGRILLQVQSHGEAWYVLPETMERYYLADGNAAYAALRAFGLGITDAELRKIPIGTDAQYADTDSDGDGLGDKLEEAIGSNPLAADTDGDGYTDLDEVVHGYDPIGTGKLTPDNVLIDRLKGRILLQVQGRGQAWYVYPIDGKRYYMKDGGAAYQIMRALSLGITDADLGLIPVAAASAVPGASPIASDVPKKFLTIMAVNSGAEGRYEGNGWARSLRFKENDSMQIFEVAVWDNGVAGNPKRISLYKFDRNFDPYQERFIDGGPEWVAYRESFNIMDVDTPSLCRGMGGQGYYECSDEYREAFKRIWARIVAEQPAQHYGIKYLGHGSNVGLFADLLSAQDSVGFLSYATAAIGKKLDFLDWSSNCDMGHVAVIESEYQFTDYIVSSDLVRGGFIVGDSTGDYQPLRPDYDLSRFFASGKTIQQSLADAIDAERTFWENPATKSDMTARKIKQSLSVYDANAYAALKTSVDLKGLDSGDVLRFIRTSYPSQEQKFYDFRIHYVSNKDFFSWDIDSNGFKKVP